VGQPRRWCHLLKLGRGACCWASAAPLDHRDVGGGDCDVGVDSASACTCAIFGPQRIRFFEQRQGKNVERRAGLRGLRLAGPPMVLGGSPNEVSSRARVHARSRSTRWVTFARAGSAAVGGIWVARSNGWRKDVPSASPAVSNQDRFPTNSNVAAGNGSLYLYYAKRSGPAWPRT